MDESRLRTIEQIEQFLSASTLVAFSKHGDDIEHYEHITRVLKRFDFIRSGNPSCAVDDGALKGVLRNAGGERRRWRGGVVGGAPVMRQ